MHKRCGSCILVGDQDGCLSTPCQHHESFGAEIQRAEIERLRHRIEHMEAGIRLAHAASRDLEVDRRLMIALAEPCLDKPSQSGDGIAAGKLARWRSLAQAIIENDPDDSAADAVTCLDVWRKEAADLLVMNE